MISSILVDHLPRLVETSRAFTARLEEDPSAWGVSVAFLGVEEQLESALVEWSGVVGKVISSLQNKGDSQGTSEDGHTSSAGSGSAASSWIRRRSATASAAAQPFQLNLTMTPVIGGSKDKKTARMTKSKRLTEQDVVIMPTQRVLRYVLMYRGKIVGSLLSLLHRRLIELFFSQSCCSIRPSRRRPAPSSSAHCKVRHVSHGAATRRRHMSIFFHRYEKTAAWSIPRLCEQSIPLKKIHQSLYVYFYPVSFLISGFVMH